MLPYSTQSHKVCNYLLYFEWKSASVTLFGKTTSVTSGLYLKMNYNSKMRGNNLLCFISCSRVAPVKTTTNNKTRCTQVVASRHRRCVDRDTFWINPRFFVDFVKCSCTVWACHTHRRRGTADKPNNSKSMWNIFMLLVLFSSSSLDEPIQKMWKEVNQKMNHHIVQRVVWLLCFCVLNSQHH